jgi:hypothetical protein
MSLPDAKTDYGLQPIPYRIGRPTGVFTPRVKQPVHEVSNILHPVPSTGINALLDQLPLRLFMKCYIYAHRVLSFYLIQV